MRNSRSQHPTFNNGQHNHKKKKEGNKKYQQYYKPNIYKQMYIAWSTQQPYKYSQMHMEYSLGQTICCHKENLNRFINTEIIQNISSDHNGMKLKISNKRKFGKFTNCKLNNILLNDQWVKEQIIKLIIKCYVA